MFIIIEGGGQATLGQEADFQPSLQIIEVSSKALVAKNVPKFKTLELAQDALQEMAPDQSPQTPIAIEPEVSNQPAITRAFNLFLLDFEQMDSYPEKCQQAQRALEKLGPDSSISEYLAYMRDDGKAKGKVAKAK
jgi:hypothetical protein